MDNKELLLILRKLLNVGQVADFDFPQGLEETDLKTLIACIRDRIEKVGSRN